LVKSTKTVDATYQFLRMIIEKEQIVLVKNALNTFVNRVTN